MMKREEITGSVVATVVRDICYLYHELALTGAIMPDLDYSRLFPLPYWEFLDLTDTPAERRVTTEDMRLVRQGGLVMILCMLMEVIDDAGGHILGYLGPCATLVERLYPETEKEAHLLETLRIAIDLVASPPPRAETDLSERCNRVFDEFVRTYFAEMAAQ